jgi:carboxyl-terminal processing protease
MVAQFAKENKLATSVGTKTSGRLAARSAFKIGFGYRLTIPIAAYVSWNGTRIEGQGIQPDIPIDWSFQGAAAGRDVQLDRALEVSRAL